VTSWQKAALSGKVYLCAPFRTFVTNMTPDSSTHPMLRPVLSTGQLAKTDRQQGSNGRVAEEWNVELLDGEGRSAGSGLSSIFGQMLR